MVRLPLYIGFSYYLVNVGGWEEMHLLQEKIHGEWSIKELKKKKTNSKTYCWFASDVMLVVFRCKNKSISLLWELNYLRKKIIVLTESRIDHQHGRLVTWLQAKNINHPPPAARLVPLEPPPQAFPRLSGEHTKAGDKKEAREVAWNSSDCFESFSPLYWGSNNDSK